MLFFVMRDHVAYNHTHQRRVGSPTTEWSLARRLCTRYNGYILNECGEVMGQAVNPDFPNYLDKRKNISSGEDVCLA